MGTRDHLEWIHTEEILGSGGQGEVELVREIDDPPEKLCALKTLHNATSTKDRERFRREITAISKIDHPSIIKIIDHSDEESNSPFYVMEYHEGAKSLFEIISSPSINPYHGNALLSLDLFEQIILALCECERAAPPIVHRDVNPKNILVLKNNRICLIDFGICHFDDGKMITLADEHVGTRNYTAPECESGDDSAIGSHTDIYSAAKVLWAAINSKQAFAREEYAFKGRSLEEMFPENPETWHLTRIFERTIRRRIEDRFQSPSQVLTLVHELRNLIEAGYPPLREAGERCPSCGSKTLGDFENGHAVFGNPNPRGVVTVKCNTCGFGFVRDMALWRKKIEEREALD